MMGADVCIQDLLEPFTYTTANPGKEIRGKLIEAFNSWLKVPSDELSVIAKVVNMLHTASLMYANVQFYDGPELKKRPG